MTKPCPFCPPKVEELKGRVYYDSDEWFAFLDKTPLATGHTTLARRVSAGHGCPVGLTSGHLAGHDQALSDVVGILRQHYEHRDKRPEDFLFASLRQTERHMHTHIVPLWADEVAVWRARARVKTGGMFRFLGWLEAKAKRASRDSERQEALEASLAAEASALKMLASRQRVSEEKR